MLAFAIANRYHRGMSEYVSLRNGLMVPEATLLPNATDIYKKFNNPFAPQLSVPVLLFRMVLMINSGQSDYLTRYDKDMLELPMNNFYLDHPPRRSTKAPMARTALALNMIVVEDIDGDIEGYLQEPVGDYMPILPTLHEASLQLR